MSDPRTPEQIEAAIERDRSGLQKTINELQDTFSPDNLFRAVTDNFRDHGGDIGRSVSNAARGNPLALALTGVSLGWLIFGTGPDASRIERGARRIGSSNDDRTRLGGGRDHAYGEGADASVGPRGPVPEGAGPDWIEDGDRGPSMGQRARAGWHNASVGAGERVAHGRDAMSSGAGRVRDRSSEIGRNLAEGTEKMSHDARERIIAARERAVLASERAGASISRGARSASASINRGANRASDGAQDFFEEHPIVVGALAFAVGAAFAGALPRTRMEDDYFGERSDELYDEAERIYHEERERAEHVAADTLDEARKVGREMKGDLDSAAREAKSEADERTQGDGSAADAAVDRAESDAKRIADTARESARREGLGQG